jgi:hypothetical protein
MMAIEKVGIAVTVYTRIREVFGSNLGRATEYPDLSIVIAFIMSLRENSGVSTSMRT